MSISAAVQDHVRQQPFLEEALSSGIINYSGLARQIKPILEADLGQRVTEGAIIMALKRMAPSPQLRSTVRIRHFFARLGDFTVQSNINNYTFRNSETLLPRQRQIFDLVAQRSKVFFSFSQGIYESTIVASDLLHGSILDLMSGERMIAHQPDLSAISVMLPQDNTEVSGIYYFIFKQLATHDINIVEVISTTNEFTIVVADDDLERSFALLRRLVKGWL